MKKCIVKLVCILGFLGIVVIILIVGVFQRIKGEEQESLTSVEQDQKIVTESFPTQFVIYGDEIDFAPAVFVRYINAINEENLRIQNGYTHQMIIINDLSGNVNLSDEEWLLINQYVKSDSRYNMFYLGSKEFEQLVDLEIVTDGMLSYETDLSIGIVHEGEQRVVVFGTYQINTKGSLSEALIHEHVFALKQSN